MSDRDALVDAMLPCHLAGVRAPSAAQRADFWSRFEAVAPLTLRFGFGLAVLLIVRVMPWVGGWGRPWRRLGPEAHDALLLRCAALPGLADLVEVARLVTCFLVFDDADAQHAFHEQAR